MPWSAPRAGECLDVADAEFHRDTASRHHAPADADTGEPYLDGSALVRRYQGHDRVVAFGPRACQREHRSVPQVHARHVLFEFAHARFHDCVGCIVGRINGIHGFPSRRSDGPCGVVSVVARAELMPLPAGCLQASADGGIRGAGIHSSSVKPTLSVTCQWATLPFSTLPRVSRTWNQRIFRIEVEARSMAVRMASSLLVFDEPVSSSDL